MNHNEPQSVSITIDSDSQEQTMAVGAALARTLQGGDFLALEGTLGAGKTCFVRGLAQGMEIEPSAISSPTFVICQEHIGKNATLAHIDAYRLSGEEELESIGWNELIADTRTIMAVEWAGRIAKSLPAKRIDVQLTHAGDHARRIVVTVPKGMEDRLAGLNAKAMLKPAPVKCATCGKPIRIDDETFPFCSARCKMADLGRWFAGRYTVSRPMGEQDIDEMSNEQ